MPKPKKVDYIKLNDVPKLILELTGVTRVRATIYNWVWKGRLNYAGDMIKLKASRRLGIHYTTKAWVLKFIEEIG